MLLFSAAMVGEVHLVSPTHKGVLVGGFFAALLAWLALNGLFTRTVWIVEGGVAGPYKVGRQEQPTAYWLTISLYGVLMAFILALVAF